MNEFIYWLKAQETALIKAKTEIEQERSAGGNNGVYFSPLAAEKLERISGALNLYEEFKITR
jgi:hypothetical protein